MPGQNSWGQAMGDSVAQRFEGNGGCSMVQDLKKDMTIGKCFFLVRKETLQERRQAWESSHSHIDR